jgi:hypothetical protein
VSLDQPPLQIHWGLGVPSSNCPSGPIELECKHPTPVNNCQSRSDRRLLTETGGVTLRRKMRVGFFVPETDSNNARKWKGKTSEKEREEKGMSVKRILFRSMAESFIVQTLTFCDMVGLQGLGRSVKATYLIYFVQIYIL